MGFLTIFRNLVCWIDFELHILIVLYDLDKSAVILPMLEHSKQVISQKLSMSDRTLQFSTSVEGSLGIVGSSQRQLRLNLELLVVLNVS